MAFKFKLAPNLGDKDYVFKRAAKIRNDAVKYVVFVFV